MGRKWTKIDEDYLKSNVHTQPINIIADELGRTTVAIRNKIIKLGLKKLDDKNVNEITNLKFKNYTANLTGYSLEETIFLLNNEFHYTKYIGKGLNKRLRKDEPKLFKSIYVHSKELNNSSRVVQSLVSRMVFIAKYKANINKNGSNWVEYHELAINKMKDEKVLSKQWFKKKYGVNWLIHYNEFYQNKLENINKLANMRYSKISQELFNELLIHLTDSSKCYYAENNGEFFVRLTENEIIKANQTCYFLDFKYQDKIIEFDGEYWHQDNEYDKTKKEILISRGYKFKSVSDLNYKKDKVKIINECLNFLLNE